MTVQYKRKSAVDSLISFKNSQSLLSKGTLLSINKNVIVFEVYNPYSIVQTSEVLTEFSIKKNKALIYQGKAVVVHLVNTGLMLIVSAHLEEDWIGQLEQLDLANGSVAQFLENWEAHHKLHPEFRSAVEDIRSFLFELSRWCSVSKLAVGAQNSSENLDHIVSMLWPKWISLIEKFEKEGLNISEDLVSIHRTYVQHNLHPLLLSAPFVHRTYTKPLGYAGDYEMINMILRNAFEGETDYAKIIHKLNVLPPTPVSVRYRNDIMLNYVQKGLEHAEISNNPLKILSIACGPAAEIVRFIKQATNASIKIPIVIDLLDFSQYTLNQTKLTIDAALLHLESNKIEINYICESVHALLKNPEFIEMRTNRYDLIYSGGLFDYLSNQVCTRLLKLFYKWLKPGGKTFTTNMHSADPARVWMDYVLEWFLIYRDEKDMLAWAAGLGNQRVYADETGINLFLEIKKPL